MNKVCEEAIKKIDKSEIQGAINWADLHCVEVIYCIDQKGKESYRFSIEEAAPDNRELHIYLYDYLSSYYNTNNIEINTEW